MTFDENVFHKIWITTNKGRLGALEHAETKNKVNRRAFSGRFKKIELVQGCQC